MTKFVHEDLSHLIVDDAQEVTIEGKRHYLGQSGIPYPSITTVLGYQSAPGLHAWRKRVGEEEANRIGRIACTNGTKVHSIAEDYLNNVYKHPSNEMPYYDVAFQALETALSRVSKVYCQEVKLYSDFLQVAGRCDAVLEFDGKISIVDFKTSSKAKDYEYLKNYFIQACAYAIMFEERTNIPINDLVIISVNAGDPNPQITKERRDRWWSSLKQYIKDYYDYYGKMPKIEKN